MKILNLMLSTHLAGTERATLETMRALRQRGHDCHVFSMLPFGELKHILDKEGFPSVDITNRGYRGWRTFFMVRKHIASLAPDVVILGGHDIDALLAMSSIKVPCRIMIVHNVHEGFRSNFYWKIAYWLVLHCGLRKIFFCSDFLRHEAEAIANDIHNIAATLPNPIPLPPLVTQAQRLDARRKLSICSKAFVIGGAGRLVSLKRFDLFLQVAMRVRQQAPDAIFLVAGGGPQEDALRAVATEMGLNECVRWLGWMPDMRDFYACIDLMLFHSDLDAFGLSAAEPMAWGIPVVASVLKGGLHDLIADSSQGVCLYTHDLDMLAAKVLALRGEPGQKIGRAGRERIAEVCAPQVCVRQLEEVWS